MFKAIRYISNINTSKKGWMWKGMKITGFSLMICSVLLAIMPLDCLATSDDDTTTGSITLVPTIECFGVVVNYTGDNDQYHRVELQYRESGHSTWNTAPEMYHDRTNLQYRGSIFWLSANTSYEAKVNFYNEDDVIVNSLTSETSTRNDEPQSEGNTYYVSPDGDDNNPGTESEPFQTIQRAAYTVAPGDMVLIMDGTYPAPVEVITSGSENNYITFKNYNSNAPVLKDVLYIKAAYIRVSGLEFQDTPGNSIIISGEDKPAHSVTGVIIEDCAITNPGAAGNPGSAIRLDFGAENCLIQRNMMTVDHSGWQDRNGIYWWKSGGGNVFRDNTVTGNPWDGFGGGPEDDPANMFDCDFYNNTIYNAQDDGIQPEGGNINVRIWNNRIEDSLLGVGLCPTLLGPVYVFRNVIINKTCFDPSGGGGMYKLGNDSYGRIYSYHNTYYTTQSSHNGYVTTNGGFGNMVSRNNVIVAGRYIFEFGHKYDVIEHDMDYDFLSSSDSERLIKWGEARYTDFSSFYTETYQELNSINQSDNLFVDPSTGDFSLRSTSPSRDAGEVLLGFNDHDSPWPYSGFAPDLGAFEYLNNRPVLNTIGNRVVTEGQQLVLTVSATDQDGDSLEYSALNLPPGATFDSVTHTMSWKPTSGQTGSFSGIRFQVSDGSLNDFEDITIIVNQPINTGNGGGGGGGGGPGGITAVTNLLLGDIFMRETKVISSDLKVELLIPRKTAGANVQGQPLVSIGIRDQKPVPQPPVGAEFVSSVYEIIPDGATFEPSINLIFKYSDELLPQGVTEKNLVLATYNWKTGQWCELEDIVVDTEKKTISAKISHFSTYAVLAYTRPADFTLSDLSATPEEIEQGKSINVGAVVTNDGDIPGNYEFTMKLDNEPMDTRMITLNGGDSETLMYNIVASTVGEHSVSIGYQTVMFTIIEPPEPALFVISNLEVSSSELIPGESIDVSFLISNTGDLTGSYTATVMLDETEEYTREVTLEGGEAAAVSLVITPQSAGQHTVSINGLEKTLLVKTQVTPEASVEEEPSQPQPDIGIDGFRIIPVYETETETLIYARVLYLLSGSERSLADTRLILRVLYEDEPFEELLLSLSQIQHEGESQEYTYVPSNYWQAGVYSLQIDLYQNEEYIGSTGPDQFVVSPEVVYNEATNWGVLGIAIGTGIVLIVAVTLLVLFRRRG